jgi:ABC-2 type transport system permease protein/sodium transport system permease protein
LLGLTLWPLAHEIFSLNQMLGLVSIRPEQLEEVQKLLADIREISPIWILLSMAVAPAVFEELFFRGYLFSALAAATSRRTTILTSSLLFGLFHVVSNVLSTERFLPSTFLGLVLGWLCYHTGSVLPGIVLHACHNGFLLLIAYYPDALIARGWGIEEQSHLPLTWIGSSVIGLLIGVWLISKAQRQAVWKK